MKHLFLILLAAILLAGCARELPVSSSTGKDASISNAIIEESSSDDGGGKEPKSPEDPAEEAEAVQPVPLEETASTAELTDPDTGEILVTVYSETPVSRDFLETCARELAASQEQVASGEVEISLPDNATPGMPAPNYVAIQPQGEDRPLASITVTRQADPDLMHSLLTKIIAEQK